MVLTRELPGGLDGLGAAAHEERAVDVAGRQPRELGGQLDRARVGEGPVDRERQLAHLARRRLAHLGAVAVAGVDAEEAGERVEIATALLVLEIAALPADDYLELVGIEIPHPGEVEPEVAEGVPRQAVRMAVRIHAERSYRATDYKVKDGARLAACMT